MKKRNWIIVFTLAGMALFNMSFTSESFTEAELRNIEALSSSEEYDFDACLGDGTILCGKVYHKSKLKL